LAADCDFALRGKEKQLQAAVTALSKLTNGAIHVCVGASGVSPFEGLQDIAIHRVSGPHPSGNVGVQIGKNRSGE
jgi:Na+-transporting NADH:ubiquinone oxidoreductase, subunit NqrA